jgi:hypothetical protein
MRWSLCVPARYRYLARRRDRPFKHGCWSDDKSQTITRDGHVDSLTIEWTTPL